jgi:hypothetical protein
LGQDADDRGREEEIFHSHIDEPGDGTGCIIGMKRAQNQMSGQCRMDGDLSGLRIPDLSDEDTSGSWRTMERKALAKVSPIAGLT